jgi:hypothetical protein
MTRRLAIASRRGTAGSEAVGEGPGGQHEEKARQPGREHWKQDDQDHGERSGDLIEKLDHDPRGRRFHTAHLLANYVSGLLHCTLNFRCINIHMVLIM